MHISRVEINKQIELKIIQKHNVNPEEIEYVLKHEHLSFKVSKGRYMAIGRDERYITIFYEIDGEKAIAVTAYKSTKKQIKYYEKNG